MEDVYRLSFTFGGLLYPETVAILRRYEVVSDWNRLRSEAIHGTLLSKTRISSRYRYFREIRARMATAWPFELSLLASEAPGARLSAFVICCRYYRMLSDFVQEVVQDKVDMQEHNIELSDYYHFLERKRLQHPELLKLSESTQTKLRQVLFRMLEEGTLLDRGREHRIRIPSVPEALTQQYRKFKDTEALRYLIQKK